MVDWEGCTSLLRVVGLVVLLRRKGGTLHVALGRAHVADARRETLPVLVLHDATGRPRPFYALAVVSLATTALGWLSLRSRRRGGRRRAVHARS